MSVPGRPNRLARESSPYLLLHATNPVEWFPWGEEAFQKARREDKPIFLSVGYSTCYWCHVMERESFSSEAIAARLNAGFVSIKLDREERPDLDEIYMTATQLLTRSGGWPNSVFLTADRKPFFAGTYFPPDDRHGRPGFPRLLEAISEAWREKRESILEQADAVAQAIREQLTGAPAAEALDGEDLAGSLRALLLRRFDPEWGGFGHAPKFPSPANLFFLEELGREGDPRALEMLRVTLDRMARGGIHDQLGGGFHRYSTDAEWMVPHFEKMLYDNAALVELYAAAEPLLPGHGFARVARRTIAFVERELVGPHGGFLSAIDAETDGQEGAYYVWGPEEISGVLDAGARALIGPVLGLDGGLTFEGTHHVPHVPVPFSRCAAERGLTEDALHAALEPGLRALLAARERRKRPLVDDKVLADWNGLMIAGLARAGQLLGERGALDAAARAARFVLGALRDSAGHLLHAWRGGQGQVPAFLDDYAFLVRGLLALHAATGESQWLAEAVRLQAEQDDRLWDDAAGGYFAAGERSDLLLRSKSAHDGPTASGAGVAALNLLALASATGDARHEDRARRLLLGHGRAIEELPLGHVTLIQAARRLGAVRSSGGAPVQPDSGVLRVRGRLGALSGGWRAFEVRVEIAPGWHLQANPASDAALVATALESDSGTDLRALAYPEAETLRAGFSETPLQVWSGEVVIRGELRESGGRGLRLVAQACDDARCLAPVVLPVVLEGGEA